MLDWVGDSPLIDRISSYPTHAPQGKTTHAPLEKPHMPQGKNHARPPAKTMHPPAKTTHPPAKTTHAPPGSNHARPPEQPRTPPPLTESQTPVKILPSLTTFAGGNYQEITYYMYILNCKIIMDKKLQPTSLFF